MFKGIGFLQSKFGLALSWYLASVCTLVVASVLLVYTSFPKETSASSALYQSYKALPTNASEENTLDISIGKADARVLIIDNFFKERKSPLLGLGEEFVKVADQYEIDYRLLPAITMQESNGGKRLPQNSFNPFGYGIYGGKVLRFDSFTDAIHAVGKGLRRDYLDQGLATPEEIMPKYTPPSVAKGGAWAIGVSAFMDQLR